MKTEEAIKMASDLVDFICKDSPSPENAKATMAIGYVLNYLTIKMIREVRESKLDI